MASGGLCMFYGTAKGCREGTRCRFVHSDLPASSQPCHWYNTAEGCRYGDLCHFSHAQEHSTSQPHAGSRDTGDAAGHAQPEHEDSDEPEGWQEDAEQWEAEQAEAWPEHSPAEPHQQQQGAEAEAWDESAEAEYWDQQDPWGQQDEAGSLSAGLQAVSLEEREEAEQPAAWQHVEPAPSPAHPPVGSGLCPDHFTSGDCQNTACELEHGDYCETCGRWALDPRDSAAQTRHMGSCQARWRRHTSRQISEQMECCICLEVVMDKPPEQRKFGLMGCDHCFCLTCIRSWRTQTGADLDTAVRTCPLCRASTWFITPSTVWPLDPAEKDTIIDGYKRRMATINCRHFDFGTGRCPFGSSCFYRHADEQGRPLAIETRWYGDSDGKLSSMQPILLSSFLDRSSLLAP